VRSTAVIVSQPEEGRRFARPVPEGQVPAQAKGDG
jgi:hypothetical protein